MVGGALVATDRRTSGTQVEDEAIELKARARIDEALGDRGHAITTSYNRVVLITGEVPTAADKALVGRTVEGVENVRSVVNELAVAGTSSLIGRSSDTIITGKVKTAFLDAKDLMANSVKVVTERGTVYLMGRVTEREATRAADIARSVGGVQKVVRVFEVISEDELARCRRRAGQRRRARRAADHAAGGSGAKVAAGPRRLAPACRTARSRYLRQRGAAAGSVRAPSDDLHVLGARRQVAAARALAVQLDLQPQVVDRVGVAQRVLVGRPGALS